MKRDYTEEVSPATRPLKFLSGKNVATIQRLCDAGQETQAHKPHTAQRERGLYYDYVVFAHNALAKLSAEQLSQLLHSLHKLVRRGFVCRNVWRDEGNTKASLTSVDFWCLASQWGWNDGYANFDTWEKPEGGPIINFNWLEQWRRYGSKPNFRQLNLHSLYDTAFGDGLYDLDYTLHSHPALKKVQTLIEPMAGIANYSFFGHFQHPKLTYIMSDVDESASDYVQELPWREDNKRLYFAGKSGDVLDELNWAAWDQAATRPSLAEIRKQSYQMFDLSQIMTLMHLGTKYADYLLFETLNVWGEDPKLADDALVEDVSSAIAQKIGLTIQLASPRLTGTFNERFDMEINARFGKSKPKTVMNLPQWTLYSVQTLVLLAQDFLKLHVYYINARGQLRPTSTAKPADLPDEDSLLSLVFCRHRIGSTQ